MDYKTKTKGMSDAITAGQIPESAHSCVYHIEIFVRVRDIVLIEVAELEAMRASQLEMMSRTIARLTCN